MIDILLSTYNGDRFLREQVFSLEKQTVQDLRILIRDDGSTDQTLRIIEDLMSDFDNITLIKTRERLGSCRSFFELVKHSQSDYLMFCDQDDFWLEDKVEKELQKLQELEREYGRDRPLLVFADAKVTDERLVTLKSSFIRASGFDLQELSFSGLLVQNKIAGNSVIFNRALKEKMIIPAELPAMHDHWLALTAAAFGAIGFVDEPLCLYRQHRHNVVGAAGIVATYFRMLGRIISGEKILARNRRQALLFARTYAELERTKQEQCRVFGDLASYGFLERYKLMKNKQLKTSSLFINLAIMFL